MITVGDLSAHMIGSAAVRVEHEGSTVSGQLMNVRFEVDRDRLYRGGTPEWIVSVLSVEIQVGSIYLDNLEPNHPIELVR